MINAQSSITPAQVRTQCDNALDAEFEGTEVALLAIANSNAAVWSDVVNIADKGVLTGIAQGFITNFVAVAGLSGQVRITVDGVVLGTYTLSQLIFEQAIASGLGYNSLPFSHRFLVSLRVEHFGGAAGATLTTAVSYTKVV